MTMMIANPMTGQVLNAVEGSHSDLRDKLSQLIRDKFGPSKSVDYDVPSSGISGTPFIADIFDSNLVYQQKDQYYRIGYAVDKSGAPKLSSTPPVKVRKVTQYFPEKS